jgi:peroxiredoxin
MKQLIAFLVFAGTLAAGPLAGQRAASFTLPDSNTRYYDLLDYRGKVVLLDIMKTDCPHCQVLSKTLERVKARYGDRIQILSIVTLPDNATTVANYIAKHKVTSPILFDMGQATAALLRLTPRNSTVNLPTLLVLDPQGIIRSDFVYLDTDAQVKPIFEGDGLFPVLDNLLKQTAAAPAKK